MTLIGNLFYVFLSLLAAVKTERLAVDPMSIFVDSNLFSFCWKPIGQAKQSIQITNKILNVNVSMSVDLREEFGKGIYCIYKRDKVYTYTVPLEMTTDTTTPKIIKFKIKFDTPFGPAVDIIRHRKVPKGIYFEINPEFGGLSNTMSPFCQIFLISGLNGKEMYQRVTLKNMERKNCSISFDVPFTFYYTCDFTDYILTSSKFIKESGIIDYDAKATEMEPIIQIPFRRFIKVTWKHRQDLPKRYDLAVYLKKPNGVYECLKMFRIFPKSMLNEPKLPNYLPFKCDPHIPIEDLGYFDVFPGVSIYVILDMFEPLDIYQTYKLSIFGYPVNGKVLENYLHFNPLPNENSGAVNPIFLTDESVPYDTIINSISKMDQSVLSKNNKKLYKFNDYYQINLSGYTSFDVYASLESGNFRTRQNISHPQMNLAEVCSNSKCSANIHPYFYIFCKTFMIDSVNGEMIQLQLKQKMALKATDFEFKDNNYFAFKISWQIFNCTNVVKPALFAVKISKENVCHSLYILYCRTCNKKYYEDTISDAKKYIDAYKKNCTFVKELRDSYDAVDCIIKFNTDKMPSRVLFNADLLTLTNENFQVLVTSLPDFIRASSWQLHQGPIIGIIGAVIGITLLVLLFLCCKHLSRDPESKESKEVSTDDNMYDQEDNM